MKLPLAAFSLLLSVLFPPTANSQSGFSWRDLIAAQPSRLAIELRGVADCSAVAPLEYRLNSEPTKVTVEDFSEWYSPTKGRTSFVLSESFSSKSILQTTCTFGETATLLALSHEGKIFSLNLRYKKCDNYSANCNLVPNELDTNSYQKLKDLIIAVPILGTGEIANDELQRFLELEADFRSSPLPARYFTEVQNCFFPGLKDVEYRCLLGVTKTDETAQAYTFVEIDRSTLLTAKSDVLLVGQSLANFQLQ